MKKKKYNKKLVFSKETIHVLAAVRMRRAKGGADNSFETTVSADANCGAATDSVQHTYTNNLSCPGGYSCILECIDPNPGATAIGRCATGGLCIPSYSCHVQCS
jgi:hypothetical protein